MQYQPCSYNLQIISICRWDDISNRHLMDITDCPQTTIMFAVHISLLYQIFWIAQYIHTKSWLTWRRKYIKVYVEKTSNHCTPKCTTDRFGKSRYIDFIMHLDNYCVQIYNKKYASRFVKMTYNLEKRE